MSEQPPEIDEADLMLAEAARTDLVIMRHLKDLVLDTRDAAKIGTFVHAYGRASRAMRQNLALLTRQKAERARAAREAAREERERRMTKTPEEIAYETRAEHLSDAVERVISAAADGDKKLHADWVHRFDRELDDWYARDDFLEEGLGIQVRRACRKLGLPEDLAARWADLPMPTFFPDPQEADHDDDDDDEAADETAATFDAAPLQDPPADGALPPPSWRNSG